MLYEGTAYLSRWVDGDTCEITVRSQVPCCTSVVETSRKLRLKGINAPEMKTEAGLKALGFVNQVCPPGPCDVAINGFDKYGRWEGSVSSRFIQSSKRDVGELLIESGNGVKVAYGEAGSFVEQAQEIMERRKWGVSWWCKQWTVMEGVNLLWLHRDNESGYFSSDCPWTALVLADDYCKEHVDC